MTAPAVAVPVDTTATPPAPPATTTVAPVAPAIPPEQPAATEPAKTGPLSRRDARDQVIGAIEKASEAQAAADAPAVTEPTPGEAPATEPVAAAPEVTAPAPIRVAIDPNHPALRPGQRLDALTAATAEEEQFLRTVLNGTSFTRRQELETERQRSHDLQRQVIELQSRESTRDKLAADPKFAEAEAKYTELLETYGQDVADRYRAGVKAEMDQVAREDYDGRLGTIEAQEVEQAGQAWKSEAYAEAKTMPAHVTALPGFNQWFEAAVESFNSELELGHFPNAKNRDDLHTEFKRFFGSMLVAQPSVRDAYAGLEARDQQRQQAAANEAATKAAEVERIRKDAVEQHMKDLAAKRGGAPPHPLGSLPTAGRERPTSPGSAEGRDAVPAGTPATQVRRQIRDSVAEESARRYPGR
jgi:hypothetical protein